jgi:hypothetical protein
MKTLVTSDLGAGFQRITTATMRYRMIVSTRGQDGIGKTHWGLTAPEPIAFINFDEGDEGVVEKFVTRGKEIHQVDFKFDKSRGGQEEYKRLYARFTDAYRRAITGRAIRTVLIDKGTDAWELAQLAEFGRVEQILPLRRMELNREFSSLIHEAFDTDVNVIWTHRMRKQYVASKKQLESGKPAMGEWNGQWEPAEYSQMRFDVQVCLEHYRDAANGNAYGIRVQKCRQNGDLLGMELPGFDFPALAQVVFPDSGPGDWE